MTLRFVDSFDHYATGDVLEKWTAPETSISTQAIATGTGRRGTNGWTSSGTSRGLIKGVPNHATHIIGFAVNFGGAVPTVAANIIEFREGGQTHLAVRINADLSLSVRRATTTLATVGGVLPANGFFYLEFKGTVHDTTGAYEVRVNGANVLSASGIDTRDGGAGVTASVVLGCVISNMVFDDLYICDGAGSTNNDFLGDVRVDCFQPSGNGNSSQLLGSDGNSTDNYLLVDETAPNDDTDYVSSSTVSQKDTYAFPNMSHTPATINGVQVVMSAKKDDAGLRSIASVTRSGGADTDGTTQAVSTSYFYYMQILETDPNTAAAWTQSGFDAAEFGIKVAA